MKQLWALRYVLGMLLVFGLTVSLAGWAVARAPVYVGLGAAVLVVLIVLRQPHVRRERARIRQLVDAAFQAAYAPLSPPPSLVMSSSYGYPAFQVWFRSQAELDSAVAQNQAFQAAIAEIFKGYGSRRRPFRAELAIYFTYGRPPR